TDFSSGTVHSPGMTSLARISPGAICPARTRALREGSKTNTAQWAEEAFAIRGPRRSFAQPTISGGRPRDAAAGLLTRVPSRRTHASLAVVGGQSSRTLSRAFGRRGGDCSGTVRWTQQCLIEHGQTVGLLPRRSR